MKRIHIMLIFMGVLAIVAVLNLAPYIKKAMQRRETQRFMARMRQAQALPQEMGNKNAKVVIEIIAPPSACEARAMTKAFKKIVEEYPDKVYVKTMASPPKGVPYCLGVLINGKQKFKIGDKTYLFSGPIGRRHGPYGAYGEEELKQAVKQEIEKVYGKK